MAADRSLKTHIANYLPFLIRPAVNTLRLSPGKSYILLYHSFTHSHDPHYMNVTRYDKFYRDLDLLSQHFSFTNQLESMQPGQVAITFDDGYRSLLPVLKSCEQRSIPTTLFLNAYALGSDLLLPKDKITMACRHTKRGDRLEFLGAKIRFNNRSLIFRERTAMKFNRRAIAELDYCDYEDHAEALFRASAAAEKPIYPDLAMLGGKEIANLRTRFPRCRIGSHGHNHFDLTRITDDSDNLSREISQSRSKLEKGSASDVSLFSYPYGLLTPALSVAVQQHYRAALTTLARHLDPSDTFDLPRISVDRNQLRIA